MPLFFYTLAVRALAPFLRLWLRGSAKHRPLLARFAPPLSDLPAPPLWVHACSVGEVNTALPLLRALAARFPDAPVVLTTATASGHALARERAGVPVLWCPFDHPRSVARFLDTLRPRALVLIETELWPHLLLACHRRAIPVVVTNGRLSDKHFPRYRRFAPALRAPMATLAAVSAQSDDHAARFIALGADPARVHVTGSTKFDAVADAVPPDERARLRRACKLPAEAPLLVFGSTRPGDEALAAACWRRLREEVPGLRLVIAPRHIQRADEVRACFDEPVTLRSALEAAAPAAEARVLLVDTVGELVRFYALATVAVVGGSFYPGVEGHNPLEPCALGVPTVFGPHMANFLEPARVLVDADAAVQVPGPDALHDALLRLLQDPAACRQLGTRARKTVLDHRGAVDRNVDLIARVLAQPSRNV